jgi:hypothetical protein
VLSLTKVQAQRFLRAFIELKLKPDDFIVSGRRDKSGAPVPISVDNLELRVKAVMAAASRNYPSLRDAIGSISHHRVSSEENLPSPPPPPPESSE